MGSIARAIRREWSLVTTPRLEPDVTVAMEADLANRFWLGKLNLTLAMAKGR